MARIRLDDVTKVFQEGDEEIVAVDELNLDIQDGEFLVLVGPSGCGKSTTLRMIAGLEAPTSGEIYLGDTEITNMSPQKRDLAMVFQSYALYPHMSVRGNMSFGLREASELSDVEIQTQVEDTSSMLGINELLDRKPQELSGGQQQRVALGRAIVRDPEVFLLDEPLANLDAKLRAEMRTELQKLQTELDTTTVYVTHDQTEAMTMSDRIAILNDGRLQQVGAPLECYHEPNNVFVAGFLGEPSMNFYDATLRDGELVTDAFTYPLSDDLLQAVDGHSDLVFGIRPEDIEVRAGSENGSENETEFPTTVDVVEPMGDENTVHLRFDGHPEEMDAITATLSGMRSFSSGQRTTVRIPEEAIHLFDTSTGDAVRNRQLENTEAVEQIGAGAD